LRNHACVVVAVGRGARDGGVCDAGVCDAGVCDCHLRNTLRESSNAALSMSYIVKFFDLTFDSSSTN
jgi:hypothetical protein